jgi:hypothetical protein
MFHKDARLMVLDQDTPAGMMTLDVKVSENDSVMAGHFPFGDFRAVRYLLEAMGVESISLDSGAFEWSAEHHRACADAFHGSLVECY